MPGIVFSRTSYAATCLSASPRLASIARFATEYSARLVSPLRDAGTARYSQGGLSHHQIVRSRKYRLYAGDSQSRGEPLPFRGAGSAGLSARVGPITSSLKTLCVLPVSRLAHPGSACCPGRHVITITACRQRDHHVSVAMLYARCYL